MPHTVRNGRVLIVVPTRSRPESLDLLLRSVSETSKSADVVAYVDEDQAQLYTPKCEVDIGPRDGTVRTVNRAILARPEYSWYGMMPDDATIETPKWDEWLLGIPDDGLWRLVSPFHNFGRHVDMPFVNGAWVDRLQRLGPNLFEHYCWPTANHFLALLVDPNRITYAGKAVFAVTHEQFDTSESTRSLRDFILKNPMGTKFVADSVNFVKYVTEGLNEDAAKLSGLC